MQLSSQSWLGFLPIQSQLVACLLLLLVIPSPPGGCAPGLAVCGLRGLTPSCRSWGRFCRTPADRQRQESARLCSPSPPSPGTLPMETFLGQSGEKKRPDEDYAFQHSPWFTHILLKRNISINNTLLEKWKLLPFFFSSSCSEQAFMPRASHQHKQLQFKNPTRVSKQAVCSSERSPTHPSEVNLTLTPE